MPASQLDTASSLGVPPAAVASPAEFARQRAGAALALAEVDPMGARRQAVKALAEASRLGDDLAIAQAEQALGIAARALYDMAGSAAHLERAIYFAELAGVERLAAQARVSRALALAYCGRIGAAHRELDLAAAALEGDDLARVELRRAAIFQFQGRLDDAEAGYSRALPQLVRTKDLAALASLYNNRGLIRFQRGSLARAEADYRQAIMLHQSLGHTAAAAETSQNLGLVAARRGDVIAALAAFDEVDRDSAGTDVIDAVGLLDRTDALLAARLLVEARATAERGLREQQRRHLSSYLAETRLMLARIALCEGNHSEARQLAERSARAFSRQGRGNYRALADEVRIRARWLAGERTASLLAASRRAASALEQNGFALAAIDARLTAGQIALALGRQPSFALSWPKWPCSTDGILPSCAAERSMPGRCSVLPRVTNAGRTRRCGPAWRSSSGTGETSAVPSFERTPPPTPPISPRTACGWPGMPAMQLGSCGGPNGGTPARSACHPYARRRMMSWPTPWLNSAN